MNAKEQISHWWIYKITNPNNRIYIGKTSNWKARKRQHRGGSHESLYFLHHSIRKYGADYNLKNVILNTNKWQH